MDGNKTAGGLRAGGLSHSHVGAIAGVAIFLVGVVMMFDSWRSAPAGKPTARPPATSRSASARSCASRRPTW